MTETRQVVLMRTDLGMSIGKMVAQGGHAFEMGRELQEKCDCDRCMKLIYEWKTTGRTKLVLAVKSEEKMDNLIKKAIDLGIYVYTVEDEGRTTFDGVRTRTCTVLGIDTKENLDKVTKRLRLL